MINFVLGEVSLGRNLLIAAFESNISTYDCQSLVVDTQYC